MKTRALGIMLAALCSASVAAPAPARWHVTDIQYHGKSIISGTSTFPTNFTVHRGDTFMITIKGDSGIKFDVVSFLLPVKSADQASTATTATQLGKLFVRSIDASGAVQILWKVDPHAKLGVHEIEIASPPRATEPFVKAAGDNRWSWGGVFVVAP